MESKVLAKMRDSLVNLNLSPNKGLLIAFIAGLALRMIPELVSLQNPIGFDTVYYAWRIKTGVIWYHWSDAFSTWILYAALALPNSLLRMDPFLLLKLIVPLIFGLNAAGVFYTATRAFGWSAKKGLLASGVFSFQLAALRISWDLYRNLLGLGVLLFALPLVMRLKCKRSLFSFTILSILVVMSHEYSAIILLATAFGILIFERKHSVQRGRMLTAIMPSLCLFLISVFVLAFPITLEKESSLVNVGDAFNPRPGGLFFLVDYLQVHNSVQNYLSYFNLASDVLLLFCLLFLVQLPLVLVGAYAHRILDSWLAVCLIGSFSCLILPFCAMDLWSRWMFMLVYPFTFYMTNGIWKAVRIERSDITLLGGRRKLRRVAWLSLSLTILLGMCFMTSPLLFGRIGFFSVPNVYKYFPPTMQANTIPLEDINGVKDAFHWLDQNTNADYSCLLVHHAFLYWARFCLENPCTLFYFQMDADRALDSALDSGFQDIYFVWWSDDLGWYGVDVPRGFLVVFRSSRVAVYRSSLS